MDFQIGAVKGAVTIMEIMKNYKTVSQESSDFFIEKKSKFIGHCKPVKTEGEALEFIKKIKTLHSDANHNVHAYVLRENGIMRYSDDGEPQGTAGIPVMDVIQKSGLTDIVLVVTRYFGGTLLGGGGLVRAYSHSATIGIKSAVPITMCNCIVMSLSCDYNKYTKAETYVKECGGEIDDTIFADDVTIEFHIVPENLEELKMKIADLTAGKGQFEEVGQEFMAL